MAQVIVYERVSTKEQDLTRQAVQREHARRDYPGVEPVVIQDDGISAFKVSVFDRPGGAELVALIQRGDVAAVYTDEQSRLSRGKQSEWWQFVDVCEINETRIVINGQEIRPWEDEGDEIKSALDQMISRRESRNRSNRTRGGMLVSAERGRVNGGPRRFGFEKVEGKTGTLTPRWSEVAVAELMCQWAKEGKSQIQTARDLNAH